MNMNEIYVGHVLDLLKDREKFPEKSIDCIVTSPPYYALRDYGSEPVWWDLDENCNHKFVSYINRGVDGGRTSKKMKTKGTDNYSVVPDTNIMECEYCEGIRCELGREPTPQLYIKHLCDVFDACSPVLKDTATVWVNLGDTYSGSGGKGSQYTKDVPYYKQHKVNIKKKSLMGIPQRFMIEMVDRGWICRNVIIWNKPNAFPQPHKDKLTISHEYIYLFVKQQKYFFKQLKEPLKYPTASGMAFGGNKAPGYGRYSYSGNVYNASKLEERNMRTVWEMNTASYKGSHFAVFPEELPERCIYAGCPVDGIVFDPFMGTGTTAVAALRQNKKFLGCDIVNRNLKLSDMRLQATFPLYKEEEDDLFDA